jgi:hypothetical protein
MSSQILITRDDLETAVRPASGGSSGTAERMLPDSVTNGEIVFCHAVTLANTGSGEESLPQDSGRWR